MNEELMDKIMERCKTDPQFAEVFDFLLINEERSDTQDFPANLSLIFG